MSALLRVLLAASVLWLLAQSAHAHQPSDAYLSVDVGKGRNAARLEIAVRDLDFVLGLDSDADNAVTWGEMRAAHDAIAAYALARVELRANGEPCPLEVVRHMLNRRGERTYAVLVLALGCERVAERLEVEYRLLFDVDAWHRAVLLVDDGATARTRVLSREHQAAGFDLGAGAAWPTTLASFVLEGIWHIAHGIDHVLFVLTLLLPVVLHRRHGRWVAAPRAVDVVLDAARLVTAFTISHSITLGAAVLGIVALPAAVVEPAIAASVALAALNNIFAVVTRRLWLGAFVFGLVHGFGFAGVLTELGLPADARWLSLLGFNLGIELGQFAIVALLVPVALAMRRHALYPRVALAGGSALIAIVATVWFVERIAFG